MVEPGRHGLWTVAAMPSLNAVSQMIMHGELDVSAVAAATAMCMDGCARLWDLMRQHLLARAQGAGGADPPPADVVQ